jgi:hypothetical protein
LYPLKRLFRMKYIKTIHGFVVKKVTQEVFDELLQYLKEQHIPLWGEHQQNVFLKENLDLCLFKDLSGVGYGWLARNIKLTDKLSLKSIHHNIKLIRKTSRVWTRQQLELGNLEEWMEAAKKVKINRKLFTHGCLWMDSIDLRVVRKGQKRGKKSKWWSYKVNSPGHRYMCLRDGNGMIRKLWGGYSPKLYDSHFLQITQDYLEEKLRGAGVFADEHFRKQGNRFDQVRFYTPYKTPSSKDNEDGAETCKFTDKQVSWNKQQRTARARVENTFGLIHNRWKSLQKKWPDEMEQIDHLVWISAVVNNSIKKRNLR